MIDSFLIPEKGDSAGLRSFSLCGYGSIGKTQIAMDYAFKREDQFHAIFWIQADEETKIAKAFDDIAHALGLVDESNQGDKVVSRNKVLEWLSRPRMQPPAMANNSSSTAEVAKWLIIFDKTDNAGLVRDYWPMSAQGSILVTSRDPTAKTDLAVNGIDLLPMSNNECALLLQKQVQEAPSQASDRAALELAKKLGNFPLALTQIATQIRRRDMTIGEYLGRYSDTFLSELSQVEGLPLRVQYRCTVASVWRLEKFTCQALSLVQTMVFMDPDAVPEFILEQSVDDPFAVKSGYPKPGDSYVNAQNELCRTSIVKRNKITRTLAWHRIVREVIRGRMSDTELQNYFGLVIDLLSQAWEYIADRFHREKYKREKCSSILPHLEVMIASYHSLFPDNSLAIEKARKLVKLLQEAGWYLVQRGAYGPALPAFKLAMHICEAREGKMKMQLADTLFSYARYGEETNMDPAIIFGYCLKFHQICKELDDGSQSRREDVATSHTSLAQGYLLLDKFDEAAQHCQKCIDMETEFPDHVYEGAISQFAHIYQSWAWIGLKKFDHAAKLALTAIEYREKKFGEGDVESIKLGLALHCLGIAKQKLGQMNDSYAAFERALENFQTILGPDSFRVGQVKLKLGELLGVQEGCAHPARVYFDQAIKTFERLPYYKPELARALFKKAAFVATLNKDVGRSSMSDDPDDKRAVELHREIRPHTPLTQQLGEAEFDLLVRFWSR